MCRNSISDIEFEMTETPSRAEEPAVRDVGLGFIRLILTRRKKNEFSWCA